MSCGIVTCHLLRGINICFMDMSNICIGLISFVCLGKGIGRSLFFCPLGVIVEVCIEVLNINLV